MTNHRRQPHSRSKALTLSLATTLASLALTSTTAEYYCGSSYLDALDSCNTPCPSSYGYPSGECPEDKPFCFGPNMPCEPPANVTSTTTSTTANEMTTTAASATTMSTSIDASVPVVMADEGAPLETSALTEGNATATDDHGDDDSNATATTTTNTSSTVFALDDIELNGTTPSTMAAQGATETATTPAPPTLPNPDRFFCGATWSDAIVQCNTNPDAVPCPPGGPDCPSGTICFGHLGCTPMTDEPTVVPTPAPTTAAPTTLSPTSSPIAAADEANARFCGTSQEDVDGRCDAAASSYDPSIDVFGSRYNVTGLKWCRYGTDDECPEGQTCFLDTTCNATELNITLQWDLSLITEEPTPSPTSLAPTIDLNPKDFYCQSSWVDGATYEGACGIPCPSGQSTDCPSGEVCIEGLSNCNKDLKGTKWCGATFQDMADRCADECPYGTDEECPVGQTCWGDSPCPDKLLLAQQLQENGGSGLLWCGRSYKQLVEECPKQCPGGTDDECGIDPETSMPMICYNMAEEEVKCAEEGVGIKNKTDSANLWCGQSWNHVLENCERSCPEGSDEECPAGSVCFDLTGSDLICMTEGYGVKEKGDPDKMFCGATYEEMLKTCPKRCPSGESSECPAGMSCFQDSPCEIEGQGLEVEEKDPTKMFCGSDWADAAATCSMPCPSGGSEECGGLTCFSDVECGTVVSVEDPEAEALEEETTMDEQEEESQNDKEEEGSSTAMKLPTTEAPEPETTPIPEPVDIVTTVMPAESLVETTTMPMETANLVNEETLEAEAAEEETPVEPAPAPEPASEPAASEPAPEPASEPAASEPAPEPASEPAAEPASEPAAPAEQASEPVKSDSEPAAELLLDLPPEPASEPARESETEPAEPMTVTAEEEAPVVAESLEEDVPMVADNVRMALYGLDALTPDHVIAWEKITAQFVESWYGSISPTYDPFRNSISDVSTTYEVTGLNLSSGRRLSTVRKANTLPAYLFTYKQTIEYTAYTANVTVDDVIQYPFSSPAKRSAYVSYLQVEGEGLFDGLQFVSAVMIPAETEGWASGEPVGSALVEESQPTGDISTKGNFFFCGADGTQPDAFDTPCSSAVTCPNPGDVCYFVPNGEITPVAPYTPPATPVAPVTPSTPAASVIVGTEVPEMQMAMEQDSADGNGTEVIYPENTYFCGSSMEDASRTCGIPCPSRGDDECPGEDTFCFGNTFCEGRQSFYCGTSWLDASDKCLKACPSGDANDCDEGEACFAWTSCDNTDSYFCGITFGDASSRCETPCQSRSSLECPPGEGCFAYTTCSAVNLNSTSSEIDPLDIPMNDYFCGESLEHASSACPIACQGGSDEECPGDLKCYNNTGCSDRNSFFCGNDWMDAAQTCGQACSSGSSDECDEGQMCFSHTGCQTNLFFCGDTFEDASESCTTPCSGRSSDECPGEQSCFAFVTNCTGVLPDNSTGFGVTPDYTSMALSGNLGIDSSSLEGSQGTTSSSGEHAKEPDWMAGYWSSDMNSSLRVEITSLGFSAIACFIMFLFV